jgi:lipopolysaccharide transport system permease protein
VQVLWTYRQMVWETALSDLRHRYAGSALGVFWNVLTPLAMLAILTFVFTNLLTPRFATAGLPPELFPLYLGSGFLAWVAFVDCVTRGANALVANSAYLKKMPIPEVIFVAQSAVSALLGMLIAMSLLVFIALLAGQPPQATWLLLPVVALLWQMFGFGLALVFGTLNVFFRDVGQVLGVCMQIWMWSLPIVYLEDLLPTEYQAYLPLNPGYPFVAALHDVYLYALPPPAWVWAMMSLWALLTVGLGWSLSVRLRSEVRDAL